LGAYVFAIRKHRSLERECGRAGNYSLDSRRLKHRLEENEKGKYKAITTIIAQRL